MEEGATGSATGGAEHEVEEEQRRRGRHESQDLHCRSDENGSDLREGVCVGSMDLHGRGVSWLLGARKAGQEQRISSRPRFLLVRPVF